MIGYEKDDHVVVITLNRPEARNAINGEMARGIEAAVDRFESEDDAWVGIITGAGTTFCAGADLKAVAAGDPMSVTTKRGSFAGFVARERTKPMIAAVNGPALAGGCEIALTCDLIVGSTAARFGLPEVKRSLIAAAGGLFRLPRAIPKNIAMEMALTGDPIGAERAYELGLLNELCEDGEAVERARALALRICANAPLAVQASRRILLRALVAEEPDAWRIGNSELKPLFATEDFREGPRAYVEKRAPVWQAR